MRLVFFLAKSQMMGKPRHDILLLVRIARVYPGWTELSDDSVYKFHWGSVYWPIHEGFDSWKASIHGRLRFMEGFDSWKAE